MAWISKKLAETVCCVRSLEVVLLVAVMFVAGCVGGDSVSRMYRKPYYPKPWSLAVVPFTNTSGNKELDVIAVTDEFYTELQQIEGGVRVMPVDKVRATLIQLGIEKVSDPTDVTELAQALQLDGVIVGTITKYDPYPPSPQVGMMVQLYDKKDWLATKPFGSVDPGKLARSGKPFVLKPNTPMQPTTMVLRIVDAGEKDVISRMKKYAKKRGGKDNPWCEPWKEYTTSRKYLRFVAHDIIGELLGSLRQESEQQDL